MGSPKVQTLRGYTATAVHCTLDAKHSLPNTGLLLHLSDGLSDLSVITSVWGSC